MADLRTTGPRPQAARDRYRVRVAILMTIYVVIVLATAFGVKHVIPPGPWRYLAALVPALPLLGVIAAIGLYLREEADEFRRMVYVQSMLWGLAVILALTTVWGFIELLADAPHIQSWWIFPIYCVAQDLARHLIARGYR